MAGAIGLRYETLAFWLDLEQVPRSDWPAVVDGVQAMEAETLRLMRNTR